MIVMESLKGSGRSDANLNIQVVLPVLSMVFFSAQDTLAEPFSKPTGRTSVGSILSNAKTPWSPAQRESPARPKKVWNGSWVPQDHLEMARICPGDDDKSRP